MTILYFSLFNFYTLTTNIYYRMNRHKVRFLWICILFIVVQIDRDPRNNCYSIRPDDYVLGYTLWLVLPGRSPHLVLPSSHDTNSKVSKGRILCRNSQLFLPNRIILFPLANNFFLKYYSILIILFECFNKCSSFFQIY